jgi:hypothetical protein
MAGPPGVEGKRVFAGEQEKWCLVLRPGHGIVGQVLPAAQTQACAFQALHGQMPGVRRLAVLELVGDQQNPRFDLDGRKQLARAQIGVQAAALTAQRIEIGFSHAVSHWIVSI